MLKLQSQHGYHEQLHYVCPRCRLRQRALSPLRFRRVDTTRTQDVAIASTRSGGPHIRAFGTLQGANKKTWQIETPYAAYLPTRANALYYNSGIALGSRGDVRSKVSVASVQPFAQVRRASSVAKKKSKTKATKIIKKVPKGGVKKTKVERRARQDESQKSTGSISKRSRSKKKDDDGAPIESIGKTIKAALGSKKSAHHRSVKVPTNDLKLEPIPTKTFTVPGLAHGLDRVLFNPGICHVRDPRSRVFNFDPHLEEIMPVQEFDFNTLTMFITPSQDKTLAKLAADSGKKYFASTSSFTSVLKHFHFLLSDWRELNLDMLSKAFPIQSSKFTRLTRAPDAVFLRYNNGVYAMDADKEYDSANVLSLMGRYMEKLLTLDKKRFDKHRVGRSHEISKKERNRPEAYHYSTTGDFVFRSQLDAYDPRLPGTGMFDLKTRAVVPIRADAADFEWGMGYEIRSLRGEWQSFEREYHDMIRSTLLKYSLQARMGRMDGIFVAFHNIARIFGFQYISLDEMDLALHGQSNRHLGDKEFLMSVHLFNRVLDKAIAKFPEQSLRIHVETREASKPFMYIFVEPVTDDQINEIQNTSKEKIRAWEDAILAGRKPQKDVAPQDETDEQNEEESKPESSENHAQQLPNEFDMRSMNVEQDVTSEFLPPKMTVQDEGSGDSSRQTGERPFDADPDTKGDHKSKTGAASDATQEPDDRISRDDSAEDEVDQATDSTTPGDREYLNSMPETVEQGPLLGMVLDVQSFVNQERVGRPSNEFTKNDDWEVDYNLAEIGIQSRAWAWYEALKRRREKTFAEEEKQEDKQRDYYLSMLKNITMDSIKWREEVDAQEKAEPKEHSKVKMRAPRKGLTESQSETEDPSKSPSRSSSVPTPSVGSKIDADEQMRRVQEYVIEIARERVERSTEAKQKLPADWTETLKQDKTIQETMRKFMNHYHHVAENVEKAAAKEAAPNLVNFLLRRAEKKSRLSASKAVDAERDSTKAEGVLHTLETPPSSGQSDEANTGQ